MELEAVRIAKARAEALRDVLERIVHTADETAGDNVVLDRKVFNDAKASLHDDSRYR